MKYEVSTPKNTKNTAHKQPLESSRMEIPDYAIERLAKCLLPLMRKHFESLEEKSAEANAAHAKYMA